MRQQLWLRRRKFVATTDSNHTRPFVHLANAPPVVHVITMEAYNLVTTGLPELIQIQAR